MSKPNHPRNRSRSRNKRAHSRGPPKQKQDAEESEEYPTVPKGYVLVPIQHSYDPDPSRAAYNPGPSRGAYDPGPSRGAYGPGPSRGAYGPGPSRAANNPGPSRGAYDPGPSRGAHGPGPSRGAYGLDSQYSHGAAASPQSGNPGTVSDVPSLPRHVFFILSALLSQDKPMTFEQLQRSYDGYLDQSGNINNRPNLRLTLQQYPQLFEIQLPDQRTAELVSASCCLQLCDQHGTKNGCSTPACGGLHLCKFFLNGSSCRFGDRCMYGHDIQTEHNYSCLKQNEVDGLNIHQVRRLLGSVIDNNKYPQICKFYNTSHTECKWGSDGSRCPAMHVCLHYVKGDCVMGHAKCKRSHNILSQQAAALLSKHGVNISRPPAQVLNDVRQALQDTDIPTAGLHQRGGRTQSMGNLQSSRDFSAVSLSDLSDSQGAAGGVNSTSQPRMSAIGRSRTSSVSSEVTDDGTNQFICMFHLRGGCLYKDKCLNIHCTHAYQWQYRVQAGWRDFDDHCNTEVEFNFTDPNNEVCASTSAQLSGLSPFKIDFERMKVEWFNSTVTDVRRLSTPSSVDASPRQTLVTRWCWYWRENDGRWLQFGQGVHKSTVSCEDLERNFLQNPDASLKFKTDYNEYVMDLSKMVQMNVKFGTERKIRRRPTSQQDKQSPGVLAAGDVRNSSGGSTVQKPAVAQGPNVPDHWDMDAPSNDPYFQLVKIDKTGTTAAEYGKVQARFEETMSASEWSISSIERIQNMELWEGFTWKHNWMKQKKKAQVEQKFLFHGTKDIYLDAICRQGIDWRLSGKSVGTLYGKGSYFARDARYSHDYCGDKMLLVRVLVGEYTTGLKEYTRPPPKSANSMELYDSCVDNPKKPKIHVVFDQQQSYPEYVITYGKPTQLDALMARLGMAK